jgi:hypothetical protein
MTSGSYRYRYHYTLPTALEPASQPEVGGTLDPCYVYGVLVFNLE